MSSTEQPIDVVQEILMYFLVATYTIIFTISMGVLFHALYKRTPWNLVKLLKCLLPWPIFTRDIDMIMNFNNDYLTQTVSEQTVPQIFIGGLPGYLIFSTYFLLVLFWMSLYYLSHRNVTLFIKRMKVIYVVVNLCVYAFWFLLLFLMYTFPEYLDTVHNVEGVYAASLNLFVALGFLIYGVRLLYLLKHSKSTITGSVITSRIQILTIFCTIMFSCHSAIILITLFFLTSAVTNLIGATFNDLFCEVLPTIVILLIICWPSNRVALEAINEKKNRINNNSPDDISTPINKV